MPAPQKICEHCLEPVAEAQAHEVEMAIRRLDGVRRQSIAKLLGVELCPFTLCAHCFTPMLAHANAQVYSRQYPQTS